jgi:hypothetical protein
MTTTTDESLESELRELFAGQARNVRPRDRDGLDAGLSSPEPLDPDPRRRRLVLIAVAAVVAVLVLAGGALVVRQRSGTSSVATASGGTSPRSSSAAHPQDFSTEVVTLRAQDFAIEVGGQHFVVADPPADLHSDHGNATYQTLEVTWVENGVEMRWNIYLASDGVDWWVSEMRTYNGAEQGDWVTFEGERFRTPLGQAYRGDVDLTASEGGYTSYLVVTGLELQGFLQH